MRSNIDVAYVRESPANFNCSYIAPASSATPASGSVSYEFRPDAGYAIHDLIMLQRSALFTVVACKGKSACMVA